MIVIEYNQTIPTGIDLVQLEGGCMGASASGLVTLARSMGYALVAATISNLILVEQSLIQPDLIPEAKLEEVLPRDHLTYVITDFQGNTFLSGWPANDIKPKALTPFNAVKVALRSKKSSWSRYLSTVKLIPIKIFKGRG